MTILEELDSPLAKHMELYLERRHQDEEQALLERTPQAYNELSSMDQGITLSWSDVSVYVKPLERNFFSPGGPGIYKMLVNNVSGAVKPGNLVAMMGASGAGKSTLMAALAHRSGAGVVVDGDIRVNGRPVGDDMFHISGFMHQEDLFVSSLTVREHLILMARLKLDRRTSDTERRNQVTQLIASLGLQGREDSRIGSQGSDKVLSGGEKKRLSFATEMLTDPPLLFCDEPTTGLDSYSAHKLVHMMKLMASRGKTVLCTIHQPSSDIFNMFNQLILVAEGRIAYFGCMETALTFFERLGYICPPINNPTDFFIRSLSVTPGSEHESRRAINKICNEFAVSEAAMEVDMIVRYEQHMGSSIKVSLDERKSKLQYPVWFTKLFWLTHRSFLSVRRDPSIQGLRIVQKIGIAVMAGLCFTGSIKNTQLGVQSVQGALFILVSENTFSPMYSVLATFPREIPLFLREYRSGLYSTHIYYISKMIAMFPGLIVEPLVFVILTYWLAGLRDTLHAFLFTAFITIMTMNVSTACGCFFSSAFESVALAMACLVPFDYVLMITSGMFVNISTLPSYIGWTRFLSWLMYSNEAMSIIQWEGVTNITCLNDPDIPCLVDGDDVLQKYSFKSSNFWSDILGMSVLYVIFHILGYICILYRAKKR